MDVLLLSHARVFEGMCLQSRCLAMGIHVTIHYFRPLTILATSPVVFSLLYFIDCEKLKLGVWTAFSCITFILRLVEKCDMLLIPPSHVQYVFL
jgi:hypothetical protein